MRETAEPHIHDCTGTDRRCPCGYALPPAPRFCFSFEIYDNAIHETVVGDGFNCESAETIIGALQDAIEKLRHL